MAALVITAAVLVILGSAAISAPWVIPDNGRGGSRIERQGEVVILFFAGIGLLACALILTVINGALAVLS
ncbi:hypothetical protein [Methylobacterium bullatum]|uniref:Uncharacterized protein n=1 Tax=Methylobacterium bullatum TaxID=570505 RepID=A0AAV4ZBK2_9HYPH|nr:hypothetical protein [Methylobacterium bullatum]MBD8902733.1 hypothetical protein [Methylobacterium bullatum]GJD41362.1 hypothetical protein OICFNHDK_3845 [Methylobacterium bullatum]